MNYIVYKTTCLINNKIYIGVHKTENPDIFDGYLGRGLYVNNSHYIKYPIAPFHYAVKKYGVANFKRDILFIFPGTPKGQEDAFNKESELVTQDFVSSENTYNVCLGGKGRPRPTQLVYQFDFNGSLVSNFQSILEASKSMEVAYSSIQNAIQYKTTSCNSLWAFESQIDISQYKITKPNYYYIYDSDGNFIKEFQSNKECVNFLNSNTANLSKAVKSQIKINGYFISTEKFDKLSILVTKLSGKLNRYDLNGNYIDSFNTVKEAKQKLGLKLGSLSSAIKTRKQCNGFYWTRTDYPEPEIQVPDKNIKNTKKPVLMFDTKGNLVKEFKSRSEAEKEYKGCGSVLLGKCKQSHGYVFKYK